MGACDKCGNTHRLDLNKKCSEFLTLRQYFGEKKYKEMFGDEAEIITTEAMPRNGE